MKWMGVVLICFFSLNALPAENSGTFDFSKKKFFNRRANYPVGLNAYAFSPVGLALTADWFVTPKFAIEAGGGFRNMQLDNGFTVGARYHFFGKTFLNITPYVGIYSGFHHNGSDLQNHAVYVPVGIHRIKKNHWSWSVEIAWQESTFTGRNINGAFRIGYRFGGKKNPLPD